MKKVFTRKFRGLSPHEQAGIVVAELARCWETDSRVRYIRRQAKRYGIEAFVQVRWAADVTGAPGSLCCHRHDTAYWARQCAACRRLDERDVSIWCVAGHESNELGVGICVEEAAPVGDAVAGLDESPGRDRSPCDLDWRFWGF